MKQTQASPEILHDCYKAAQIKIEKSYMLIYPQRQNEHIEIVYPKRSKRSNDIPVLVLKEPLIKEKLNRAEVQK